MNKAKEEEEEEEVVEEVTPSSSPPTPPSPLPISVGPGNSKYSFSSSPSASPPFSPAHQRAPITSAFSLSLHGDDSSSNASNCLHQLLEWFVFRCCSCCTTLTLSPAPSKPHQT